HGGGHPGDGPARAAAEALVAITPAPPVAPSPSPVRVLALPPDKRFGLAAQDLARRPDVPIPAEVALLPPAGHGRHAPGGFLQLPARLPGLPEAVVGQAQEEPGQGRPAGLGLLITPLLPQGLAEQWNRLPRLAGPVAGGPQSE